VISGVAMDPNATGAVLASRQMPPARKGSNPSPVSIEAATATGVPNPAAPGQWMQRIGRGSQEENRRQVKRATTRRNITQEFLKQAAEIHNSAPAGRRMHDLQAAYPGVTERQLRRYIAAAREKGFIND